MSLTYHNNYSHNNQHESRIKQLEQDKAHLSHAIEQLNMCYQHKIRLLQGTISQQQERYDELLEWKQQHINKSLFEVQRYENEIKKMIEILDNSHKNFEQEKQNLIHQIQQQGQRIRQLTEENEQLNHLNEQSDGKTEYMVKTYLQEIQKLRHELRGSREESIMSQEYALREITGKQNIERNVAEEKTLSQMGGSFMVERDPILSKISIRTLEQ